MPAHKQHRLKNRWARPQKIRGESVCGGGRRCAGCRPLADARADALADGLEWPDPAPGALPGQNGRVVDGLIEIRLAARQPDADQPHHLVRHGNEGLVVRLTHPQALGLERQGAFGHARGLGALAQDVADHVVAVPRAAASMLQRTAGIRSPRRRALTIDETTRHGAGTTVHWRQTFHHDAPVSRAHSGTQARHPWPPRRQAAPAASGQTGALQDASSRHRFGPLDRTRCHLPHGHEAGSAKVGGTSQRGGDLVRRRRRAYIRMATASRLSAASKHVPNPDPHARGRVGRLMNG